MKLYRSALLLTLLVLLAPALAAVATAQRVPDSQGVYRISTFGEFTPQQVDTLRRQLAQSQNQQAPNAALPTQNTVIPVGTGTGFLVVGRRFIITNNHVVNAALNFGNNPAVQPVRALYTVSALVNGEPFLSLARLVATLPDKDLALLETEADMPGRAWPIADFDASLDLEIEAQGFPGGSELVTAAGSEQRLARTSQSLQGAMQRLAPSDLAPIKTQGRIQRVFSIEPQQATQLRARVILHSAVISQGNSGGPLINRCGQVVGVNTFGRAQTVQAGGAFFSISSREVATFLRAQSLRPTAPTSLCFFPGTTTDYVPYVITFISLLLALSALAVARRRPEIVQQSVQAVRRTVARAISRPVEPRGGRRRDERDDRGERDGRPPPIEPRVGRAGGGERATIAAVDDFGRSPAVASGRLRLVPLDRGPELTLDAHDLVRGNSLVVGRGQRGPGLLSHESVSRNHARLRLDSAGQLVVTDLGSGNGTWKGGKKIGTATFLNGDEVRIGDLKYRVMLPGEDPPTHPSWRLTGTGERGEVYDIMLVPARDPDTSRPADTEWLIGRDDTGAEVPVREASVSSSHARFRFTRDGSLEVSDAGSTNGTEVNGRKVARGSGVRVQSGSVIRFGSFDVHVG